MATLLDIDKITDKYFADMVALEWFAPNPLWMYLCNKIDNKRKALEVSSDMYGESGTQQRDAEGDSGTICS